MYIKFKKDHPVGIDKGICKDVDHNTALEFVSGNYAEEIGKEEYDEWAKEFKANETRKGIEEMEAAVKANEGRDLRPQIQEDGQLTKGKKKVYHRLSKADIEVNGKIADGFKQGDQVVVDIDSGDLAVGPDNKLIAKGND